MKVLIISNCQSVPIAYCWRALRPRDTVREFSVQNLVSNSMLRLDLARIKDRADILLYVPVSNDYPAVQARQESMVALKTPLKVRIAGIYFDGLFPDLTYIGSSFDRVESPLGDYHSRIIVSAFIEGVPCSEAARRLFSEEAYEARGYLNTATSALHEMRRRDEQCDVKIAPTVEMLWRETYSFFTVNHPTNVLVLAYVREILKYLQLPSADVPVDSIPASLNRSHVWPIPGALKAAHKLKFPPIEAFKSDDARQTILTAEEFTAKSYASYWIQYLKFAGASLVASEMNSRGTSPADIAIRGSYREGERFAKLLGYERQLRAGEGFDRIRILRRDIAQETVFATREASAWSGDDVIASLVEELAPAGSEANTNSLTTLVDALREACVSNEIWSQVWAKLRPRLGALGCYQYLIAWNQQCPDNLEVNFLLSEVLRVMGQPLEAIAKLMATQDSRLQPGRELRLLAHLLMDLRYPAHSIAVLRYFGEKTSVDGHDLALIGYAYEALGRRSQAYLAYVEGNKIAPQLKFLEERISALKFVSCK